MSKFSRQIKELKIQSENLAKDSKGLFAKRLDYHALKEFNIFYEEIIEKIKAHYQNTPMVIERLDSLPKLTIIEDYDNLFTLKTWFKTLIYVLFPPVGIAYSIRHSHHERTTKSKLKEIATILSSVETLTRFE